MKDRLPLSIKLGYGVGDLGGNLFFSLSGFYLLFFFTDVVGIPAGAAGVALMIGKAWDAISDPLVGILSDRMRTPLGRRRPLIAIGAVLLFISMLLLFAAPRFARGATAFGYVTATLCLLNTAYTLVSVPYGALTPELTKEFHERTVLNGFRMSFAVIGTFIGAGAVLPLVSLGRTVEGGWLLMAAITGGIMMVTSLIVVLSVQERLSSRLSAASVPLSDYLPALRSKEFLTALIPWTLHITGVNLIQASILFYFRIIYGDEAAFQTALIILLSATLLTIPLWVAVAKRIGKKRAYNLGMGVVATAALIFFVLGHRLGIPFSFGVMAVAGLGLATNYVMPFSIIPDVVEFDAIKRGRRREGVFYGLWTFASKLGQAVALALNGWILQIVGYHEGLIGPLSDPSGSAVAWGVRLLVGPLPALLFFTGILVLCHYPLDRERYEALVEE